MSRTLVGLLLTLSSGCSSEALVGLTAQPDAAPSLASPCEQLLHLGGEPLIDGMPELNRTLLELPRDTWRDPQNPMPDGLGAEYQAAWTDAGLYLYVQVTVLELRPSLDDSLWCGDAVHLFVDSDGTFSAPPAYDAPGTRQFIVAAPADGSTPNTTRAGVFTDTETVANSWVSPRFGAFPRPGGYSVEALIGANDLGVATAFAAASSTAFSVAVSFSGVRLVPNPSDASCEGRRLGDIALRFGAGDCVTPHCNVDAFCVSRLTAP